MLFPESPLLPPLAEWTWDASMNRHTTRARGVALAVERRGDRWIALVASWRELRWWYVCRQGVSPLAPVATIFDTPEPAAERLEAWVRSGAVVPPELTSMGGDPEHIVLDGYLHRWRYDLRVNDQPVVVHADGATQDGHVVVVVVPRTHDAGLWSTSIRRVVAADARRRTKRALAEGKRKNKGGKHEKSTTT